MKTPAYRMTDKELSSAAGIENGIQLPDEAADETSAVSNDNRGP